MLTSLTRNALIFSGGRGLRLLWLRPGNRHRASRGSTCWRWVATRHGHAQIWTDLKILFAGRFLGECVAKCIFKIPQHLAYVATLFCETLLPAKHAINDKLQGSVATYLRCVGVVNNQIKKGLLQSLWVILKSVNICTSGRGVIIATSLDSRLGARFT